MQLEEAIALILNNGLGVDMMEDLSVYPCPEGFLVDFISSDKTAPELEHHDSCGETYKNAEEAASRFLELKQDMKGEVKEG